MLLFALVFLAFLVSLVMIPIAFIFPSKFDRIFRPKATRMVAGLTMVSLSLILLVVCIVVVPATSDSKTEKRANRKQIQAGSSPTTAPTPSIKTADTNSTDTENVDYHPPAMNISGYPGLNKVLINATIGTNESGIIFTNNENQKWQYCIATINPDAGHGNWYEYDFGSIPAGQSYAVRWNQLRREDGAVYSNTSGESKIIELSCELGAETMGFARLKY